MSDKKQISDLNNFEFQPSTEVWDELNMRLDKQFLGQENTSTNSNLEHFSFEPSVKVWSNLATHFDKTAAVTSASKIQYYQLTLVAAILVVFFLGIYTFYILVPNKLPLTNIKTPEISSNSTKKNNNFGTEKEMASIDGLNIISDNSSSLDLIDKNELFESDKLNKLTQNAEIFTPNLIEKTKNKEQFPNTTYTKEQYQSQSYTASLVVPFLVQKNSIVEEIDKKFTRPNKQKPNVFITEIYQDIQAEKSIIQEQKPIFINKKSENELIKETANITNKEILKLASLEFEKPYKLGLKNANKRAGKAIVDAKNKIVEKPKIFAINYELGTWRNTEKVNHIGEISKQQYQQVGISRIFKINHLLNFSVGLNRSLFSSFQTQELTFNFDGLNFTDLDLQSPLAKNKVRAFLPNSIGIGASSAINYAITTQEKIVYYGIPLSLQAIKNINKFVLTGEIGVNPSFLANHSIVLSANEQRLDRLEIQQSTISKFNLLGCSKVGVGYKFTPKVLLNVSIFGTTSFLSIDNEAQVKPNVVGLGLFLSKEF